MKTEKVASLDLLLIKIGQLEKIVADCVRKIEVLTEDNADLVKKNTVLANENKILKEQVEWFKRQIFGRRTERDFPLPGSEQQFNFFDLVGLSTPKQPILQKPESPKKRRKPVRNGQDAITLPDDLPIEITIVDIPEEEKICKETGVSLTKIGDEVTQRLAHKPGSYYIKEIIRPKYAVPGREEAGILTAELPDSILPRCSADESLLAEVITKKFVDHLPLYRITEGMSREGIGISRKLLSQWVVKCGMALLPLYNEMNSLILQSGNIFIDETPVNVQASKKVKKGYMWVLVGGKDKDPPYRIYDFRMNRCHNNVFEILTGYKGVIHSDKYQAYVDLAKKEKIAWAPCWSHIRRYFFEAESGDPEFRKWVLRKIRYLFMLERVAWARSIEERLKIRREKEYPIIEELIAKIKAKIAMGKILPKSKLSKAIGYFLGLVPYLKTYMDHPYARLDNNPAERAVRPLALGRKNWLFFGSEQGGKSAAVLLSLVQTCRGLEINPREYLEDVFRRIMSHNSKKLYELLPDQWLLLRGQTSGVQKL